MVKGSSISCWGHCVLQLHINCVWPYFCEKMSNLCKTAELKSIRNKIHESFGKWMIFLFTGISKINQVQNESYLYMSAHIYTYIGIHDIHTVVYLSHHNTIKQHWRLISISNVGTSDIRWQISWVAAQILK